jgi:hypothetical protein
MTQIIAVSKLGKDVLTESSPNNFIFHSSYNTFKILAEGTYSPTLGDTGGVESSTSVAHNQSFTPFVFVFCEFSDGRIGSAGNRASGADFWFTNLAVNSSNIIFYYVNSTGGNYSPVFKYYITEVPL